MEYYSIILTNETGSFVVMQMDLESFIQSEVRKRKILYINMFMWNLEIWFRWTYLQGRNRGADLENRLMDTVEEEGCMYSESSIDVHCCCCCLVAELFLTLCDPMDCCSPGFSVHEISQARILEWIAISFSKGSSDSRIKPASSALSGRFFTTEPPGTS